MGITQTWQLVDTHKVRVFYILFLQSDDGNSDKTHARYVYFIFYFYNVMMATLTDTHARYVSFIFYFYKMSAGGGMEMLKSSLLPGYSRLSFSTMIKILPIICGLVGLVDLRIVPGRLVFCIIHPHSSGRYIATLFAGFLFVFLYHTPVSTAISTTTHA